MTIERISYSKIFPIASFINEKIGIDLLVEEGDDPGDVFAEAKRLVEKFHADNIPKMEIVANEIPIPIVDVQYEGNESLIDQINSCTNIKVLESYKLIARTNPEWNEAYRNKLIELQNK